MNKRPTRYDRMRKEKEERPELYPAVNEQPAEKKKVAKLSDKGAQSIANALRIMMADSGKKNG
ncbi:MAG: hypothetical protein A2487_19270 [Candidatus Raymondbacteria bacterium RifOxyC12_full_50_8]|uniref:Uncharacterized protein n=1 Tax=Candidatus Raymondbacteria bacterium RIFOXYD12_FULL_49_13 TaxID=1817890 RepID=A0A1F7FF68_UNCRA|nr:MAG: hypothetical protein A2248_22505 [Candidatus Raymondbacteria bacterium RIFOXYA2_FULL_49_16]OGK01038.1 MAG: hypothetical protein A2350_11730 [Candidatus Raymondbacteria bacterium RifOxyB12_full_50_8]OGK03388.1 MAG: hypothetical protein A2487_19270 [Candidatus Raymondbacteria bacterium RifOxyC12_full_50_8]OGK05344.1 MAG: hypothetical protein A2519_03455 [Candidatus Raymondbacteria bacterium RIFOXYD12_FULL_49_13]OGP42957.1 MAG: hypothetical protein A2324_16160 [Candidatus Raymondbacteria b